MGGKKYFYNKTLLSYIYGRKKGYLGGKKKFDDFDENVHLSILKVAKYLLDLSKCEINANSISSQAWAHESEMKLLLEVNDFLLLVLLPYADKFNLTFY